MKIPDDLNEKQEMYFMVFYTGWLDSFVELHDYMEEPPEDYEERASKAAYKYAIQY